MSTNSSLPSVYPTLRYRDAPAAIEYLKKTFGLTEVSVHTTEDGRIAHAELAWGNGLVMLSSGGVGEDVFDLGPCTVYLAVDDPDAHYARAVAAGATIVRELRDEDYGSRDYAARDAEGNVWAFGTYRPGPKQ